MRIDWSGPLTADCRALEAPMNMEDVKAALKSLGIDPSFIRHMEITGPARPRTRKGRWCSS